MEPSPGKTKPSALRGMGEGMFFVVVLLWAGLSADQFPTHSDPVSSSFHWFFATFRFWPAVALLAGMIYTVAKRVDRGDPFKEDLSLLLTVLGFVLSVVAFVPSWRDAVLSFFSFLWNSFRH